MNDDTSPTSLTTSRVSHDEISQRAQQLWENLGRPEGRDEEIWLQAERELQAPAAPTPTSSAPILDELPNIAPSAPAAAKTSTKGAAVPRKSAARSSKAAAR